VIPFRIHFDPDVQRQIYSLPHHVYMRVRAELASLAETAAVAPPVARWLDPGAPKHLPEVVVEGWRVACELDPDARVVRVVAIRKLDAGGSSVA
jgi:mRNA-degrading endonuclease RelE of RelBE toxin-antitoxin system